VRTPVDTANVMMATGTQDLSTQRATQGRLPSLDGFRALSILLVIASHLTSHLPLIWRVDYGNLGVRTFFVISGFLITSLLLKEYARTGTLNIQRFYARRFMRLAPAYYVFVAIVAALISGGFVTATYHDLIPTLLYFADYQKPVGTLGHTWSLAVEEQFYLLWPGVILLLGLRRSLFGCAALLLVAPAFRALSDFHLWPTDPKFAFESVCDALATGCLLAMMRDRLWAVPLYRKLVESSWVVALPSVALLVMALHPTPILRDIAGLPLLNIGVAMTLDRYMRFPTTAFGRLLNWKPIAWIGTLSYSLYLWQQLWVFLPLPLGIKILGMFVCAAASYEWIERPVLELRTRIIRQPLSSATPG
jgi:peptidoglycan/LPS O-acetylase OafA/YrhL